MRLLLIALFFFTCKDALVTTLDLFMLLFLNIFVVMLFVTLMKV